jgi:hypothetical protein
MEKSRPDQVRPTKSTDIATGQGQTNDSGYGKDIKGEYSQFFVVIVVVVDELVKCKFNCVIMCICADPQTSLGQCGGLCATLCT